MIEKIKAEIKVWHRREPTFHESKGVVLLDDYEVVAKLDLRLPVVNPKMDAHRYAAAAFRLTQHIDLTWGDAVAFHSAGSYARPGARSTAVGDLIFIHIDGGDLRVFEVCPLSFRPVQVLVGSTKERKAA